MSPLILPDRTLGSTGGVLLDSVAFTTDPNPYEPLNWTKRHSVHKTLGGGQVIQDFGVFMTDNTLKLGSGNSNFLEGSVMKELHRRWRMRGAQFTFTDWLNNSFIVFMTNFVPTPLKRGGQGPTGETVDLWLYTMDLQVVTIIALLGDPYTGE